MLSSTGTFTVKVQLRVLQQHPQIHSNLGHWEIDIACDGIKDFLLFLLQFVEAF